MKRLFISIAILLCGICSTKAIPADPTPKKVIQPDGTSLTVLMRGDEHRHLLFTEDGYPLFFNLKTKTYEYARLDGSKITGSGLAAADKDMRKTEAKKYLASINIDAFSRATAGSGMRKAPKRSDYLISDFPTIGRQKSLVILIQFSDVKFSSIDNPHQFYDDMLNKEGFTWSNGANGSARDFYLQSSNSLFDPDFTVVGPVTLSNKATYYGSDDEGQDFRMGEAIKEACELVDDEVDFSEYDTNGDGYVDNIYFFYAGGGQADDPNGTELIWPHSAIVEEAWDMKLVYDDKVIGHYACSNELRYSAVGDLQPSGIGTFVHEFGHVLGLVDHYDTSYGYFTFGLGAYDTMASGSYNNNMHTPPLFSAFERAELAWLDYDILDNNADSITMIPNLASSNKAFRVNVPGKDNEFFVLENRIQSGFDTYLPGQGMLVWHIDQDKDAWEKNIVNIDPQHQRVDIVEADGILSEATRSGDTFPGFAGITQYELTSWDGASLVSFDDVTLDGDTAQLLLAGTSFSMPAPATVDVTDIADSSFVFSWAAVEHAKYYEVSVYCTDGNSQRQYIGDFDHKRYTSPETIKIDGLVPLTDYVVAVSAGLGSYMSEEKNAPVQTLDLAFAKRKPAGLAATDVTETGFKAKWEAVRDADDYRLTVMKHGYSDELSAKGYDFSNKAEGMPDTWTSTSSMFYSVSGYYGEKAPSLRLSSDGDYLVIAYNEMLISNLSFWCRAKSNTEKIYVEADQGDGVWTEVSVISPSVDGATERVSLDECKQVRLRYGRTSGFVVIDDVVAEGKIVERTPVSGYDGLSVGNVLSYDVKGLNPGATYSFIIRAAQNGELSISSDECALTLPNSTGISQAVDDSAAGKTEVYDLSGRRMPAGALPHGVYIINGKKVVK